MSNDASNIEIDQIDPEDKKLTAEQLDDKYNPDGDGEHPVYTPSGWCESVVAKQTLCGYWEWVKYQLSRD
jgi:hypothetical protein